MSTLIAAEPSLGPLSPHGPTYSLDANMFPSIVDAIISHSDRATRFAMRQTSREHRDRVDAALCAHLTLFAEGLIALTTSDGQTVPCIRASGPGGERLPGLKWSAFEASEQARFLALLKYARVLDLEVGRAAPALATVADYLTGVRIVRCKAKSVVVVVPLPFGFSTLESDITLQCCADIGLGGLKWRQPPIAEAVLAPNVVAEGKGVCSTWCVKVHFDPEEPGLCGARVGLRAPSSVKHVRLEFRPMEFGSLKRSRDDHPEPRELGMLADAVAMAAHCIEKARFTIALDARKCNANWVSWPREEMAPGELIGAVYRAVRRTARRVIGDDEGVESAMRRFRFVGELDDE